MPIKSELKKWIPHLGTGIWLQALPLLVMFSVLWFTAQDILGLFTNTVKFWEYVLYGWAYRPEYPCERRGGVSPP
jgi:hypothetical protein